MISELVQEKHIFYKTYYCNDNLTCIKCFQHIVTKQKQITKKREKNNVEKEPE